MAILSRDWQRTRAEIQAKQSDASIRWTSGEGDARQGLGSIGILELRNTANFWEPGSPQTGTDQHWAGIGYNPLRRGVSWIAKTT